MRYFMEPDQARWEGVLGIKEPSPHMRFLMNATDQHEGNRFRLEFVIASCAALNWLRLILML